MLFAAGFGTRMGTLTQTRPKPLIEVAGRPLLDHALALVDAAGLRRVVVNTHYLADQIRGHLADRPEIAISHEPEILETGGGLRQALPLLGAGPVFTLNTDAVWTGANPLRRLLKAWDPTRMDVLQLVLPASLARGYHGNGDWILDGDGRITRAAGRPGLVYLGAQIINPVGLDEIPDRVFSLNRLWDRAIARGRAHAVIHDGLWCDVGHPDGIREAEEILHGAVF